MKFVQPEVTLRREAVHVLNVRREHTLQKEVPTVHLAPQAMPLMRPLVIAPFAVREATHQSQARLLARHAAVGHTRRRQAPPTALHVLLGLHPAPREQTPVTRVWCVMLAIPPMEKDHALVKNVQLAPTRPSPTLHTAAIAKKAHTLMRLVQPTVTNVPRASMQ